MDCFEELGVQRRLCWTEEALRDRYDSQCRILHPDAGGDPEEFRRLGEAFAVLRSPGRRLRHWLELELENSGMEKSGELGETIVGLFGDLGDLLRRAEEVTRRKREAKSALARSLAEREGMGLLEELEAARARTRELRGELTGRFEAYEARGAEASAGEAAGTARGLIFLEKWERELRDRWSNLVD